MGQGLSNGYFDFKELMLLIIRRRGGFEVKINSGSWGQFVKEASESAKSCSGLVQASRDAILEVLVSRR